MTVHQTGAALRMLSCAQVCEIAGISKSNLYAKVAAGVMPRQVKIGGLSRWVSSEIEEWLQAQIAASRQ